MTALRHTFVGGDSGMWRVERIQSITGSTLSLVPRLSILENNQTTLSKGSVWLLPGVTSYERYIHKTERSTLRSQQAELGRLEATRAALIPIKKSTAWWELAQDERRAIFEEHSQHISIGLQYVTRIARRLYHCYDLGEPFDFLTWFEFTPDDAGVFEDLVGSLRSTEWSARSISVSFAKPRVSNQYI